MRVLLSREGRRCFLAARLLVCLAVGGSLSSVCAASFETLYHFRAPWGTAALAQGNDDAFYGATARGGDYGYGSVIRVSSSGEITTLASFANTNGADAEAGMVLADDGCFYGTTAGGGTYAKGTVFRVTTNGILTSLLSFSGQSGSHLGERPGALTLSPDGRLYGTTYLGGSSNVGTVFRLTSAGTLTTLYSFPGGNNGVFPAGGVTMGNDGAFYGVCALGGLYGHGTVYRITTGGSLTTLYSFANYNDGKQPSARLLLGKDGSFYGTTYFGGLTGSGSGTVFRITTNGLFTLLTTFLGGENGGNLGASLVQGKDDALYGTTVLGGMYASGIVSQGTLFRLTTNGSRTRLVNFVGTNGITPVADLTLARDGTIYGTTTGGGGGNAGTIFRWDTNANFTTFASFILPQGTSPQSELVQGRDGAFYGIADSGGSNGWGTVFRLTQSGEPWDPLESTCRHASLSIL